MKLFFVSLFPVVWAGRQLARVRYGRARKTLVRGRGRINAKRDPIGVDLIQNESVHLVFDFGHAGQLTLPLVVERSFRGRLKLAGILSHTGSGSVAAGAHAGVVS